MDNKNHIKFPEDLEKNGRFFTSQLFQDWFALFFNKLKPNLFFVEIGATNGIYLSNTYILERYYNWKGIIVEPLPTFKKSIESNRKCTVDTRCVYSATGQTVKFVESVDSLELSGIESLLPVDMNSGNRANRNVIEVETVSLNDLLKQHNAPQIIDYLSIDTEGSEYEILSAFDFGRYKISVITVEHNFVEPQRSAIKNLLESNGFIRIGTNVSKWDDWYVHRSNQTLAEFLGSAPIE